MRYLSARIHKNSVFIRTNNSHQNWKRYTRSTYSNLGVVCSNGIAFFHSTVYIQYADSGQIAFPCIISQYRLILPSYDILQRTCGLLGLQQYFGVLRISIFGDINWLTSKYNEYPPRNVSSKYTVKIGPLVCAFYEQSDDIQK